MTILYLIGSTPTDAEAEFHGTLDGPVELRNLRHWKGEVESCDLVASLNADVLSAYEARGVATQLVGAPAKPKPTRTRKSRAK